MQCVISIFFEGSFKILHTVTNLVETGFKIQVAFLNQYFGALRTKVSKVYLLLMNELLNAKRTLYLYFK